MMAEGTDTAASWENPLIPNARLRQIYLAMARARALAREVAGGRAAAGLEACLVSPAIDLGPGDLVSDALAGGVVEFLRGARLGVALRPDSKRKRGMGADCGEAARLPATQKVEERVWAALGAASALKAESVRAKKEAEAAGATPKQTGVVVVYVRPGEMAPALWRKVLGFAAKQELPAVFVVLPPGRGSAAKIGGVSPIALACGVPGIPVDADDAVAIYRVAQESIVHARTGGGTAVMECVPFVLPGAAGKRADAIVLLEEFLVQRGVATRGWMEREAKSFAKRIASEKAASK